MKPSLVSLGLLMMAALIGTYSVPFVIGSLIEGLRLDTATAGSAGTLEIFAIAVASILFAPLLPRFPLRVTAVTAVLLAGAAQLCCVIATTVPMVLFLRSLVGLACGVLLAVVNAVIAASVSPARSYGMVLAVASTIYACMLTGLPLAADFGEHKGVFTALALLTLLGGVGCLGLPAGRSGHDRKRGESSTLAGVARLSVFFVVLTLVYLAMGGVWSLSERVAVNIGMSRQMVGLQLGLSTVAGVIGALCTSALGNRFGTAGPLTGGFLLSGLSAVLIFNAEGVLSFGAGVLLYGFIYMFTIAFVLAAAAGFDREGRIAAATNGYLLIPYSLGPAVFSIAGLEHASFLGMATLAACVVAALTIGPTILRDPVPEHRRSLPPGNNRQ